MSLGPSDRLVIFGITGDLGYKMTLPALFRMQRRGLLTVPVLGVAFQDWTKEQLAARAKEAITLNAGEAFDQATFDALMAKLDYVSGDFTDPGLYARVAEHLDGAEAPTFYLEIPPSLFATVAKGLAGEDLLKGRARLVVEKPFGHDLASADALAADLHQYVTEEQLFRIDHYLGKEPVQDLVYLRFGNSLLEPVWNRRFVRSIMITMAEEFGVEDRGSFYDPVGTLRDVVQNHLLQVLALTGLEPPSGGSLASRRLDFFRSVESADPAHVIRGQYAGYRDIKGVKPDSTTETFIALKLVSHSWRWAGVPIYIRAGKKMPVTATEIVVRLQPPPIVQIRQHKVKVTGHDDIILRIGDHAGVGVSLRIKQPGVDEAAPEMLNMDFATALGTMPTPYERLLSDAIKGNDSLFPSQDVIDETWRIVQPIIDNPPAVQTYQPGTWGPEAAASMTRHVGGWRPPTIADAPPVPKTNVPDTDPT